MFTKYRSLLVIILFGLAWFSPSHAQSFRGLGDLAGGNYYSSAIDVSDDGSVVVGTSVSANGNEAYRWENGVMTSLRPALTDSLFSHAWGVSADGNVVAGSNHLPGKSEGFIWKAGSATTIGELPGGMILTQPAGISADGLTVTGTGSSSLPFEAFLWRNNTIFGLGDLPGGVSQSFANAISDDGNTVVGGSDSSSGREAFRWHNNFLTGLGVLHGGVSTARAVSADGSVVVGDGESPTIPYRIEAFRWENGVMVGLGDIPGGSGSRARGISADGSVIVGFSEGSGAIIWFGARAPLKLQDYAASTLGLSAQLSGWTLSEALAISADGRWIVGRGRNPNGNIEAWLLQIPAYAETLSAPVITTQPASQFATTGGLVTFNADASGNPAPSFQWQRDGVNIPGATSASLTLGNVTRSDAGSYVVIATNSVGFAVSISATLTVSAAPGTPTTPTVPITPPTPAPSGGSGGGGGGAHSAQFIVFLLVLVLSRLLCEKHRSIV